MIDVTRLLVHLGANKLPTGIDRVCMAYVVQFGGIGRAVIQVRHGVFAYSNILSRTESADMFARLLKPGLNFKHWLAGFLAKSGLLSWRKPTVHGNVYLNVGHMGIGVPGYSQWLKRLGVKPVFLVHDLIPISHPEYCAPKAKVRHVARMETVLKHGAGVITNSQASLDALHDFAIQRGLNLPPAVTALLGVDLIDARMAQGMARPMPSPYFVVVSTIEGRKNHLLLFKVWRRLVEKLGTKAPRLVVIGRRGWEAESAMDLLDRCEPLKGIVIEKPYCSDAELVCYLQHAQALLFPSHIEGFGLPLAEALSLGTPVLASDLAVFKEIAHDIPEYIDPLDGVAWLEAVQDYVAETSPRRAQQLARMKGYQAPRWFEHFAKVDVLLGQLR
ncbi:glycosyltransferase family 1 protein [Rhodoferax sp. PAMC 29310]|uniref:glycosyltransferase family 4 protein n=1 Tax=Rhodoferax sp. PAMC 29310 TaxID=2822760 RepID=UPI001F0A07A5|nr:glycosyltransferase family 1 protein [Rhodoferax sp. PAMC 29310]